jgi:hypothetical protein
MTSSAREKRTKLYGRSFCVVMVDGVNPAARCQTSKFTTENSAAVRGQTQKKA